MVTICKWMSDRYECRGEQLTAFGDDQDEHVLCLRLDDQVCLHDSDKKGEDCHRY